MHVDHARLRVSVLACSSCSLRLAKFEFTIAERGTLGDRLEPQCCEMLARRLALFRETRWHAMSGRPRFLSQKQFRLALETV